MPFKRVQRKFMSPERIYCDLDKATCGHFFLDSGAHSIYRDHAMGLRGEAKYRYYRTKGFREYVDRYAAFVKRYLKGIDLYATVDVIRNPEMSWKVLKYMENEHGLSPVPVIHHETPLRWLDKHLEAGYRLIGVGGLGQESSRASYTHWADRFFDRICQNKDRMPCVKIHGFAMTSFGLIRRYPWWSVDSASWAKVAGFGSIWMPVRKDGEFTFDRPPMVLAFGGRRAAAVGADRHYDSLSKTERKFVLEWLDEIDVPLGSLKEGPKKFEPAIRHADGSVTMKEYGVSSQYNARALANARYLERMVKSLPRWPWSFTIRPKQTFFDEN